MEQNTIQENLTYQIASVEGNKTQAPNGINHKLLLLSIFVIMVDIVVL